MPINILSLFKLIKCQLRVVKLLLIKIPKLYYMIKLNLGNMDTNFEQKHWQHIWNLLRDHWILWRACAPNEIVDLFEFPATGSFLNVERKQIYQIMQYFCFSEPKYPKYQIHHTRWWKASSMDQRSCLP